jgi:DNA polymerase III subunit alpha
MEKYFTHLHLHTDYSLLDGAVRIDDVINYGKKHNCRSVAISDHGNIFGAVKFFEKCKQSNLRPVLGIESYITESVEIRDKTEKYFHILLLVQNEKGYKNLCKLIEASYVDGFYFKPRIDYALLEKYNDGLIASSACLGGHVPQLLLENREEEAVAVLNRMKNIFEDRYYLEVQPDEVDEQRLINEKIFELEKELNIPVIATADCHYVNKEDKYAHEVMLAIQTRHTMDDPERMSFGEDCLVYMRSPEEMLNVFKDRPDIVWRTGEIADQCTFDFQTGKLFFPEFPIPSEITSSEELFKKKCIDGFNDLCQLGRICQNNINHYKNRLDLEIDMINKMGFATYFLVVSDFIQWAKQNNIAVGPGRGSVAGAIVAWALSITDVDPIKYNLLFERFLNPERVSMPDIDIDFCINGREKVIEYVKEKYGHKNVGQIITFGTMMAKGVIKDVARALGFSFDDANSITDMIPDGPKVYLKDAIESEPKLKSLIDKNGKVAKLFDVAFKLEGLTRHASKHAAGIVISPEPIANVLPIYIPTKSDEIVTQYAMTELESLGFLKMDFLGLKNLTLITNATAHIKRNKNIDLEIQNIPIDDEKTLQILRDGNTAGIFQFESSGIREVLRKLQPSYFEDMIAVNALYRPGPLGSGMVDDFIERRHGRQKPSYIFPELEEILKETYGIIVYQEQVMKIASAIGGYSLGEADILRCAMGKKKADVMEKQKNIFMSRATEKGFDKKKSAELFELMAYFAGYGFNKSHSTAYALIAYQTAYLKAHFPTEFAACLISLEAGNPDQLAYYINEAKENSFFKLEKPDINSSFGEFFPDKDSIRFGLSAIKNVGSTAIESIINERNKNGIFDNLFEFCTRVDLRTCNKRVIEYLILSGSMDSFKTSRAQMILNLDDVMKDAQKYARDKKQGQMRLFGPKNKNSDSKPEYDSWIDADEWNQFELLEKEKEATGVYLNQHPMDEYDRTLNAAGIKTIKQIAESESVFNTTRGIITSMKEITTKKGDKMAFATLEDQHNKAELVIFPTVYSKYRDLLNTNNSYVVYGDISEKNSREVKIKANSFNPIEEFNTNIVRSWNIFLNNECNNEILNSLSNQILNSTGKSLCNIFFYEGSTLYKHSLSKRISLSDQLKDFLVERNIEFYPQT